MSNTESTEQDASVKGERGPGITSVAEEKGQTGTLARILVAAVAFAGLGFLYLTWDHGGQDLERATEPSRTTIGPAVPFTPSEAEPEQDAETQPVEPEPVQPEPQEASMPDEGPDDEMLEAGMRAPVIAYSAEVQPAAAPETQPGETQPGQPQDFSFDLAVGFGDEFGPGGHQQPSMDRLRDRLQPTELDGVRASVLPDLHMVVPQGTSIPCVLQTAISSDQPGMVNCVIQRDVLSASGQVVLMEKGTSVIGEYDAGLRQGQERIFVLWNRARTPRGVIVDLASPATDALGRTGFDGRIETHFWQRFGGAMLMSIVGDASRYGFAELSGRTNIDIRETERATRDAASIALENSINIPPTLHKHQGEQVSIFVARDLDFSDVYDLRTTEPRNRIYDRAVMGDMRHRAPPIKK